MSSSLRASELATAVGGKLVGEDVIVSGACTLANPKPGAIGFVKSADHLTNPSGLCESSIWLVPEGITDKLLGPGIIVEKPRQAFTLVMRLLYEHPREGFIAATAKISPKADVSPDAIVGHFCVVGPGCEIGTHTELRHHVVLGESVRIGSDCLIKSHTVIGEEGFGFQRDKHGKNQRVPHVGGVIIENYVELGSLNTVCSGTIDPTRIGKWTKTDDHVHIAHNCTIGENCLIAACAELSGSVTLKQNVWIGPNSSILNGVTIGDRAFVGLAAVVTKDCEPGGVYVGSPARRIRDRGEDE